MSENNGRQERVLITALGTMNCTTIVKQIRRRPESFFIIGADINPASSIITSTEVDEFYQFPKVTDDREKYFKFVKEFCSDHNVSIYFCVIDEEVETMAFHREDLEKIGVTLCVANTETIVICHNKDKFALWSEQNVPEYCIKRFPSFESIREEDFPLFVKPVEGRASIGCMRIEDLASLRKYIDRWDQFVVQKFISGDIIAADVVRCRRTGLIQVCQRQELLRNSNGCGIAVQIVFNKEVEKACKKIAELLDLNGVVNIEFFIRRDCIKIIEINPRIPAGVAYSCMAGMDVVSLALDIAKGTPIIEKSQIEIGAHYGKRYETYKITE